MKAKERKEKEALYTEEQQLNEERNSTETNTVGVDSKDAETNFSDQSNNQNEDSERKTSKISKQSKQFNLKDTTSNQKKPIELKNNETKGSESSKTKNIKENPISPPDPSPSIISSNSGVLSNNSDLKPLSSQTKLNDSIRDDFPKVNALKIPFTSKQPEFVLQQITNFLKDQKKKQ